MTLALASMLVSALLVGLLIGCVGIGGVLLPPALVYVGGLEFHLAAATSAWAFLFCGVAGTLKLCFSHGWQEYPARVSHLIRGRCLYAESKQPEEESWPAVPGSRRQS